MKKFVVIFEKTRTGYSASVPDLPGCIATGKTKQATERTIYGAIQSHLEMMKEEGYPLPKSAVPIAIGNAKTFVFS